MSAFDNWNIGRPWGSGSNWTDGSLLVHTGDGCPAPGAAAVHSPEELPDPTAICIESGHSFTRYQLDGLVTVNASIVAVRSKTS